MSLKQKEAVLRFIEKEVDVPKLVKKYRKNDPNAKRATIHRLIRLEYEKKSLEKLKMLDTRHEQTFLKRLTRELNKAFSYEEEQAKKAKKGKQSLVSQKMADRYWKSVEEVKLARDASDAYERALIAWKTCPSPYKEKYLDPSFLTSEDALAQTTKHPDFYQRGIKQIAFKRKAMHRLLEKLIEAALAMNRDLVEKGS